MLATGHIDSLEAGRNLIHQSFVPKSYEPKNTKDWDEAYARFKQLMP